MLKTIELILGLPTMSIFDLIAHDMRNSFTGEPTLGLCGGAAQTGPHGSKSARGGSRGSCRKAALASARMKWSVPDAAPTERLNRILWGAIKGWDAAYPAPRHSVFSPLELETDDDDR